MADFEKKLLTKKAKNISRWYTDVILQSELADYGPVRGTMVIRPYGWAIWETVQREFNKEVERLGAENAYFPLFIPMSLLKKEKKHIEGFSPELAVVTQGGGETLAEPLAIRPTSETIMYEMYAKWISSYRDLPLKINQWNNVVRWEKRTYFFLRTLEFLWQEGHTAHSKYEEAEKMALSALLAYERLYKDVYAMPGLVGLKSEAEKFAGADHTYTIEFLMPGGKVLQGATSHNLGENFSKVFAIKFLDETGESRLVSQTSWGLSTRSIGALILTHGDDNGLVIPPKLAPIKVIIIPIFGKKDESVLSLCKKIKAEIESNTSLFPGKVKIDDSSEKSFGFKVNEAEIKGIPLKVAVGPEELGSGQIRVINRISGLEDEKFGLSQVARGVERMLGRLQAELYRRAEKNLAQNIREAKNYQEFQKICESKRGFIKAFWCEDPGCETKIKEATRASTRLLPLGAKNESWKPCIYCKRKARHLWYFGQAY